MKPTIAFVLVALSCTSWAGDRFVLENQHLGRTLSTADGVLRTVEIVNKRAGLIAKPAGAAEFRLRFSKGTDKPDTRFTLSAADFKVTGADATKTTLVFQLENAAHQIRVEARYDLSPDEFYLRKRLTVTSARPLVLERVDVESFRMADAYQPYTTREITANAPSHWSSGLGQPLYASNSATFWGLEFPAADNRVQGGELAAGYLWGRQLAAGQPYRAHTAVMGVADDAAYISDCFLDYIDRIRIRPLRLQVQYNSWFDTGGGVTKQSFSNSVARIYDELVVQRGNDPLSMHVIDDGWQDIGASWSDRVWKVNGKFDADLSGSVAATRAARSRLGLWLSPGCLFGASGQVPKLKALGYEALEPWMSLAGPRYMRALEDRMVELTRQGVGFFKLDGLFGHLNQRCFELHGARYGLPEMPQLGLEGFTATDKRLNDAKYDELKIYYLTAGTERLQQLFRHLAEVDPNIYIVISNGAYLSPWWLMSVDTIWMINAGDAAGGSTRTQELVYRDGVYHEIFQQQHAQYPLDSLFNHEPKKTSTGESKDEFRRYLYMHLSRGTGFVELYIKPSVLQPGDWDVISEGLHWVKAIYPAFRRARMHGGSPAAGEVYGYAGWTREQGFISVHNPAAEPRTYRLTLDRALGLVPGSGPFRVSSPLDGDIRGLPSACAVGDTLTFELQPREIRVINFNAQPQTWSQLKALQTRSPETLVEKPTPKATPIKDHAILGRWNYTHAGGAYARVFSTNGLCVMLDGARTNWVKPFAVVSPTRVEVEGAGDHVIKPDGTLDIEGRYTGRR